MSEAVLVTFWIKRQLFLSGLVNIFSIWSSEGLYVKESEERKAENLFILEQYMFFYVNIQFNYCKIEGNIVLIKIIYNLRK